MVRKFGKDINYRKLKQIRNSFSMSNISFQSQNEKRARNVLKPFMLINLGRD
jgi:hypothetical protein